MNTELTSVCASTRKHDFEQAERELAYIAVQDKYGFNELRTVRQPTKPREVYEYDNLTFIEKAKFRSAEPGFFRDGIGYDYFNGLIVSRAETRRNKEWLQRMLQIFYKAGDQANAGKVRTRLMEFDDAEPTQDYAERAAGEELEPVGGWQE